VRSSCGGLRVQGLAALHLEAFRLAAPARACTFRHNFGPYISPAIPGTWPAFQRLVRTFSSTSFRARLTVDHIPPSSSQSGPVLLSNSSSPSDTLHVQLGWRSHGDSRLPHITPPAARSRHHITSLAPSREHSNSTATSETTCQATPHLENTSQPCSVAPDLVSLRQCPILTRIRRTLRTRF
jgi:hypothetical protein